MADCRFNQRQGSRTWTANSSISGALRGIGSRWETGPDSGAGRHGQNETLFPYDGLRTWDFFQHRSFARTAVISSSIYGARVNGTIRGHGPTREHAAFYPIASSCASRSLSFAGQSHHGPAIVGNENAARTHSH